ncbi:50S ribosomal protein L2 [Candidatus Sneabacter namystus]|uniref:Large ribosomal subunit protein uL2 n=1 Tax=Candidatus Sneabacter namystus TaxID=2601646 RepID=A0A5C0UIZ8_9RICK|nr:50S ribosomal protein L2 [Candidatus Sneabacter namystus]QEK39769.1 50S ribosomal protein L2 [Candidatus Sneabacter namystus]
MKLKKYNPTTPGTRFLIRENTSHLWKGSPIKSLVHGAKSSGGRNNLGRITCRHKGGGHKKKYRLIDFRRNKENIPAVVQRIEYDPHRSAFIALVKYEDGELSYILATDEMKKGYEVISAADAEVKSGNCMTLDNIPVGSVVHNVELKQGKGGQIARSAGAYVKIIGKDNGYAQVKMVSSEVRIIPLTCKATIGVVSNASHKNAVYAKAGRSRWRGIRPTVRGVSMNPVDHPHGGGEGKTSGGRHPVTPWGKSTKGKKTRKNKSTNKFILRSRKR